MKNFIKENLKKIIGITFDGPKNIVEFLGIVFFSTHYKIIRLTKIGKLSSGKVAILAAYPSEELGWNLVNIAKQLKATGYEVLIVSNKTLSGKQILDLSPYAFEILERKNMGRDFGAYNHGLRHLAESGVEIERLILLNDSVFYPKGFQKWIKAASVRKGFGGITVNNAFVKHAQAFFLYADEQILQSIAWKKFWMEHKPLSSRNYNIKAGEFELSKSMRASGFVLETLIDSQSIITAISDNVFRSNKSKSLATSAIAFYEGVRGTPEAYDFQSKIQNFELGQQGSIEKIPFSIFRHRYLKLVEWAFYNRNPFSTLAIPLSYYLDMPLKKDLVRRSDYQVSWFSNLPGYSNVELKSINSFFIQRGTNADIRRPLQRILFAQGRLD